ncbi:MAG: DUF4038 domain-containing protein [Ferruginibacter sp.]
MPVRLFILLVLSLFGPDQFNAQIPGKALINISANGRFFVDEYNKPFFWQGDTEWELFHLFSVADAKTLLLERKSQGFTVIQIMITGVYPEWGMMKGVKHSNEIEAWLNQNPLTPNERYFKRADSIIAIAAKYGIILVVGVYHAIDVEKGRISLQNARPWAGWLAQRYKDEKNIVWSMYPHADSASLVIIKATLEGIREGDGGTHLITVHPDPSPKSSSFIQQQEWLSFNTLQTWSSKFINYEMVKSDYEKVPVKPVVNGEARYEGEDGTTAFESRRAGYWSYLAGGFYSYGHRDNWKAPLKWRSWYRSEGVLQMKIMGDIFRSVEWWKLVPDQSVLVEIANGNVAARSGDRDWIIVYLTSMKPVTLKLNTITALNKVTAWWIDPISGKKEKIGKYNVSGNQAFFPPKNLQDVILLIAK